MEARGGGGALSRGCDVGRCEVRGCEGLVPGISVV